MQSEATGEPACRGGSRRVALSIRRPRDNGLAELSLHRARSVTPHRSDAHNGTGRFADDAICAPAFAQDRNRLGSHRPPRLAQEIESEAVKWIRHDFVNGLSSPGLCPGLIRIDGTAPRFVRPFMTFRAANALVDGLRLHDVLRNLIAP